MAWHRIVPVVVSILVIIAVALLQDLSRPLAAITAAMPLGLPLAMWIVYAAEGGDRAAMVEFTGALFLSLPPLLFFALAAWLAARAGWKLIPMLVVSYAAWGVGLGLFFGLGRLLGR
jgi:hypothetical protein